MLNPAIIVRKKGALEMSDYEVKKINPPIRSYGLKIPGASEQLAKDLKNASYAGVSYGRYMWLKYEEEQREYYEKYGKERRRK